MKFGSWRGALTHPLLYLNLLIAFYALQPLGRSIYRETLDSGSYLDSASQIYRGEWQKSLSSFRTMGYPILLAVFSLSELGRIPLFYWQILLLGVSLNALYLGLLHLFENKWLALILCASVPLSNPKLIDFGKQVMSDGPAIYATIFCFAVLFLSIGRPLTVFRCLALGTSVFVCYQIRPDRVFLIVLLPLLYRLLHERKIAGKNLGKLFLATTVPFLGFCFLRYCLTGHFGLVPFGAINTFAVTSQLMDADTVHALPESLQGFAEDALSKRASVKVRGMPYRSPLRGDDVDFELLKAQHNKVHAKLLPLAWRRFSRNAIQVNQALNALNWAIIVHKPYRYFSWVMQAMVSLIIAALQWHWISLVVTGMLYSLIRIFAKRMLPQAAEEISAWNQRINTLAMAALCLFFFHASVIGLFGEPVRRYLIAAQLLIPMIPAAMAAASCSLLLKGWQVRHALTRSLTLSDA